jgi:hypothetical protein
MHNRNKDRIIEIKKVEKENACASEREWIMEWRERERDRESENE